MSALLTDLKYKNICGNPFLAKCFPNSKYQKTKFILCICYTFKCNNILFTFVTYVISLLQYPVKLKTNSLKTIFISYSTIIFIRMFIKCHCFIVLSISRNRNKTCRYCFSYSATRLTRKLLKCTFYTPPSKEKYYFNKLGWSAMKQWMLLEVKTGGGRLL